MSQFQSTTIDTEVLERIAKSIEENISEIKEVGKTISSTILPTLDNYWIGQAKDSFVVRYLQLDDELKRSIKTFLELKNDLEKTSRKFNNADKQVVAKINAMIHV